MNFDPVKLEMVLSVPLLFVAAFTVLDDDSDSSDEEFNALLVPQTPGPARRAKHRTIGLRGTRISDRTALHQFLREEGDAGWIRRVRMRRATFFKLADSLVITEAFSTSAAAQQHCAAHLFCALRMFGANARYSHTAEELGVPESTVSNALTRVVKALKELRSRWIEFPDTPEKRAQKAAEFASAHMIPGCIGIIDGFHTPVKTPRSAYAPASYSGAMGTSQKGQIVCDTFGFIIEVLPGFPGCMDDASSIEFTKFYEIRKEMKKEKRFLIGDAAYPSEPWLMTPYPDSAAAGDAKKGCFNRILRSVRTVVDRCIGHVKQRFTMVKEPSRVVRMEFLRDIWYAVCVLHNFCLAERDLGDYVGGSGVAVSLHQVEQDEDDRDDSDDSDPEDLEFPEDLEAAERMQSELVDLFNTPGFEAQFFARPRVSLV